MKILDRLDIWGPSGSYTPIVGDYSFTVDGSAIQVGYVNGNSIVNFGPSTSVQFSGPVNEDNQLATKSYVDSVAAGLDPKEAVHLAATGSINIYNAPIMIDGHTASPGDRILLWKQDGTENGATANGIYVYNGAGATMTRSEDMDGTPAAEVSTGNYVFVTEGQTHKGSGFVIVQVGTLSGTLVPDVDVIKWTKVSGATDYVWGNGLDISGNQVYVNAGSGLTFSFDQLLVDTTVIKTISSFNSDINGTTNYVPKFTGTNAIGNSIMQQIGSTAMSISGSLITTNDVEVGDNVYVSAGNWVGLDGYSDTRGIWATDGVESYGQAVVVYNDINNANANSVVASAYGNVRFITGTTVRMNITNSGDVGIGLTGPNYKLEVSGTVSTTGFRMTNGATAGYILTSSNSSGDAVWTAPSSTASFVTGGGSGVTNYVPMWSSTTALSASSSIYITSSRVGIGTISPTSTLHVKGTGTTASTYSLKIDNNTSTPILYARDDGRVGIGTASPVSPLHVIGDVTVSGTLYATSKSFDIQHPSDPTRRLTYASLEGPENGVYVRGKLKYNNIIELPYYWVDLVDENSITVTLTPAEFWQELWIDKIENNKVYIGSNSSPVCHYVVYAERKDISKLIVES